MKVSRLSRYYLTIHDAICGRFPNENIFHEQYLSLVRHHRALAAWLKTKEGISVLDVGCGEQPYRVLAPGGELLLSVPFLYPIHDNHDYRRLTPAGVAQLFAGWRIESVTTFGGIGSTLALLANTWVDNALSLTWPKRLVKRLIFPIRLPLHALLNVTALLLDQIDGTGRYFHNSLIVLRKESA